MHKNILFLEAINAIKTIPIRHSLFHIYIVGVDSNKGYFHVQTNKRCFKKWKVETISGGNDLEAAD